MRISDWSSDVCSSDLPLKGMGLNIWAPSRLPDVDQMARQAPWRKEHHVDSDIIARSGEARGEHFGGGGDAAQAIRVDREVEVFGPVAPLDLDEGDHPPASRDEVDFAGGEDRKSTRLNSSH